MIEKIAREFCRHQCNVMHKWDKEKPSEEFILKVINAGYENFIDVARIAIKTMREPNEEMIRSGARSIRFEISDEGIVKSYKSMIDAALKE